MKNKIIVPEDSCADDNNKKYGESYGVDWEYPNLNTACPFCNDNSQFDRIGLKHHLENYCEIYKSTPNI